MVAIDGMSSCDLYNPEPRRGDSQTEAPSWSGPESSLQHGTQVAYQHTTGGQQSMGPLSYVS